MQRTGETCKKQQLTDKNHPSRYGTAHLDSMLQFHPICNMQSFSWLQPDLEARTYLQGHTGSLVGLYASFYFLFLHHVNISMFKNMSFLPFELKSLCSTLRSSSWKEDLDMSASSH